MEAKEALGSFSADFRYDAELAERLEAEYPILMVRRGQRLVAVAILLTSDVAGGGISATGRSLRWQLGQERDGPTIRQRTYLSWVSRLTNGDFHLRSYERNDPANPSPTRQVADGWTLDQASNWVINDGYASVDFAPFADDPLVSGEPVDVAAGEIWRVEADVARSSGTLGRLRLVFKLSGRFATPDLGAALSAWGPNSRTDHADIVLSTDPTGAVPGPVWEIISGSPNLIPNGGFDDGGAPNFAGWYQGAGNWFSGSAFGTWGGAGYVFTDSSAGAPGYKWLQASASGSTSPVIPFVVRAGDEYEIRLVARRNPAFTDTDGEVRFNIGEYADAVTFRNNVTTDVMRADNSAGTGWRILLRRFVIGADITLLVPSIIVQGQTAGQWDFDSASLARIRGNIDTRTGPAFQVIPGRGYRWKVPYRCDVVGPDGVKGTVQLRVVCLGANRDPVVLDGVSLALNQAGPQSAEWVFVAPSGYDYMAQIVYSEDVERVVWVGQGTFTDADPSTLDLGVVSDFGGASHLSVDVTVPQGSQNGHVEVIAEDSAIDWTLRNVALTRVDQPPTPIAQIVAELLAHPVTGRQLLNLGSVSASGYLTHDWIIRNLTVAQAFAALCTSGLSPVTLGTRVNLDASLDVGPADSLWNDRTDVILTAREFRLLTKLRRSRSVETRVSDVEVVGAEKVSATGDKFQVLGSASSPLPGVDYFGNPIVRSRTVSDTALSTDAYANERAAYEMSRDADPKLNLRVSLSDYVAMLDNRGPFVAGDKLYFYDRTAGLDDPTNEMTTPDGEHVWPIGLKVVSLKAEYGEGSFTLSLRDPDGSEWVIPDELVVWSDGGTRAEIEVGDARPEFALDPAGGNAGDQFHRWWTQNRRS